MILGGRIVKRLVLSSSVLLIGLLVVGQSLVLAAEDTVKATSTAEEVRMQVASTPYRIPP